MSHTLSLPTHLLGVFTTLAIMLVSNLAMAEVKIVATTTDLAAVAAEVGGEHATVAALARSSEDPHYVDAKPSHIVKLNKADVLVLNGLELEVGWLPNLIERARNNKINVGSSGYFDASTVVSLMQVPANKIDRSMGDVHPGGNPHFMLDPRRGAKVALALGERLAKIDARHAEYYNKRAAAFAARLDVLAKKQTARFAALPAEKRDVVTYHASTIYLSDWLGLVEIIQVEPKPGIAPNPKHLARVLGAMRENECKVIFQEEYYPQKSSAKLAELAKGELVVIAGGPHGYTAKNAYEVRLEKVADEIYKALSK